MCASPADEADPARNTPAGRDGGNDVSIDKHGNVQQKPHGNMDETMIPQKPDPDAGPLEPAPGHLDNPKDVEPRGKDDLSA